MKFRFPRPKVDRQRARPIPGHVVQGRRRWPSPAWTLGLLVVAVAGCNEPAAEPAATDVQAFTNGNIFDGTGAPVIEDGVLLVQEGRIVEVGPATEVTVPEGAEVVDLGDRWVVPGFINAHAHVDVAGGEGPSAVDQLGMYAYYGVTTVLSLGEEAPDALELRADRGSPDLQRARVYASGPIFTPMTPEDARANVAELAAMNVDWVKIRVDSFLGSQEKMPPEVYQTVISTAAENDIPVAVHLVDLEDAKGVVRAGASLVAHSVRDQTVDQELIDLLLEQDVCVVPTLTRELSTYVYAERPDFFDDPYFLERAAPPSLDTYVTAEFRQQQAEGEGARYWREALPRAEENLRLLHEGGVGIAFGTDTGTSIPGRFQGFFEILELEMMVDAGLTPEEALLSATGVTASCLNLEGTVGTLVPNAWADFLVLEANPLEDISNIRQVNSVRIAGNQVR